MLVLEASVISCKINSILIVLHLFYSFLVRVLLKQPVFYLSQVLPDTKPFRLRITWAKIGKRAWLSSQNFHYSVNRGFVSPEKSIFGQVWYADNAGKYRSRQIKSKNAKSSHFYQTNFLKLRKGSLLFLRYWCDVINAGFLRPAQHRKQRTLLL